jgi:exosortase
LIGVLPVSSRQAIVLLSAVALVVCYASTLKGMVSQWLSDEDMSHGFLVPPVILWIVWRERARWQALPAEPNAWGFAFIGSAAALQFSAVLGVGLFAGALALLLSIAGVVICLGGVAWFRVLSFPLSLTVFALPKLALVYNQMTLPLQLMASRIAANILSAANVGVIRDGNILDVGGHRVAVAEACNGIRYLLSLGFMALVLAYVSGSKTWMRVTLLAAAVPVAIFANALRVAAAAWLPLLDNGAAHSAAGAVVFVFCLGALVVFRQVVNYVSNEIHARE